MRTIFLRKFQTDRKNLPTFNAKIFAKVASRPLQMQIEKWQHTGP